MTADSALTHQLLEQARSGHAPAVDQLLERHRLRLRRMVAVRLEADLKARADASDIVQEALAVAAARIPEYLHEPKLPFYPWLRGIAWDKLIEHRRWHRDAQRRSVLREEQIEVGVTEESVLELAEQLVASATSPSHAQTQSLRSGPRFHSVHQG
ncbi:MAG: ECF-type sigma factor [Pirellulales bacterium]